MIDPRMHLGEINSTLTELIQCQRKERELVVSRETDELPNLCDRVNTLTFSLQQRQEELQKDRISIPDDCQSMVTECRAKFNLLKKLTSDNRVLIEGEWNELLAETYQIADSQEGDDVQLNNRCGKFFCQEV